MVISLPVPTALQKETAEKTIDVKLPALSVKLADTKIVTAFRTILQAPVN